MPFITHKLGKTHYTVKGRGNKAPLIWLHGGPGGTHNPSSKVFELAKGRKVYAYTQLGSGKSSKIDKTKFKISTFVEELDLLIKAWGLKEFHLAGGSWGTTLALEYYLAKKGKGVKSISFQSPMFSASDWENDAIKLIKGLPKDIQKVINYCHEIDATDSKVYQNAIMKYYLKHVLRDKKKLTVSMKEKNPNGQEIYLAMWGPSEFKPTGTLKRYNKVSRLKSIKVPVLIVCGEHDEATPNTGIRYANLIHNCSFYEVKGASHAIWTEKPKVLAKVINEFINEVEEDSENDR
jgi:proline iminopeptidase